MNLNINDYSVDDLFDFLEIRYENPNIDLIKTKINTIKNNSNNKELIAFLDKASIKITKHLENNNYSYQELSSSNEDEASSNEDEELSSSNDDDELSSDNKISYAENQNLNIKKNNSDNIKFKRITNLQNTTFSNRKNQEIYLNMYTLNRVINSPIFNTTNDTQLDSGNSFFILPTTFNNVIEIKLIDISIDYESLSIVGNNRNNNILEISSNVFNDLSINNPFKLELYPNTNDVNSLIKNINDGFNGRNSFIKQINNPNYESSKINDPSFIQFDVCYNYGYFDFTNFYNNPTYSTDYSYAIFEIIFPKNNNNYNLANVLGFSQAFFNNKLYVSKNTIAPFGIFNSSEGSYILQAASIIDNKLDHIFFAFDDFVQNSNNNNYILTNKNQFSNYKILSKLTFDSKKDNNNNLTGHFKLSSENVIKDFNNTRYYNGPINIQKFKINILDDHNNIIFLNYKDFHFTLKLITSLNYIENFKNFLSE